MDWLVALFGGLIGAVLGFFGSFWLINLQDERKKRSLINGFYTEFELIQDYLKKLLEMLDGKFKQPIRSKYSGATEQDFSYVDSIALQLISHNHALTENQRLFIKRIKVVMASMMKKDHQRGSSITEYSESKYHIPPHLTAYLIYYCVQLIYYINDFIIKKEDFTFSAKDGTSSSGWARVAYKLASIEFCDSDWKQVEQFNSPIEDSIHRLFTAEQRKAIPSHQGKPD